ncbi:unnamed protein product [Timema podura]|uniref:Peptidase S1 domain-containing protein n=1 Tax=Timema podura TaxID=61482 RepID=A0ABN7P163_TIMPD|nr:unnamed protein product [Timema podura]
MACTAGHCVWKVSPGTLRVALGKYYRDFNKQQDFTQIRDVKEIVIQPAYQDLGGNYGSDIAVLLMASPIEFSPVVRPLCIDWELDHMSTDLADGNFGTVAGWGVNENDTFSESLRFTELQVVSDKKCLSEQPRDFKKYVTYTSFCAGYRNGLLMYKSPCVTYHDSGYIMEQDRRPQKGYPPSPF